MSGGREYSTRQQTTSASRLAYCKLRRVSRRIKFLVLIARRRRVPGRKCNGRFGNFRGITNDGRRCKRNWCRITAILGGKGCVCAAGFQTKGGGLLYESETNLCSKEDGVMEDLAHCLFALLKQTILVLREREGERERKREIDR